MVDRKEFLSKEIEACRFRSISDDIFKLYDEYEALCSPETDSYELLNLEFCRGEAYFRLGQYEKAQAIINACLLNHPTPTPPEITAKCHNILGLIYSDMGYQMLSLENYLNGLDLSIQANDYRQKTVIQINMGWLYRDLGDYEKALFYYYEALKEFYYDDADSFYSVKILCYSYIGQIYFKTNRYQEGLDILNIIEHLLPKHASEFYYISINNLRIHAFHYLRNYDKLNSVIEDIILHANNPYDFLEYSSDYLDVCQYILDLDKNYSKALIDVLYENIDNISSPFLMLNLQKLIIQYEKRYGDEASYLKACSDYVIVHQHYHVINCKSKLGSLNNIEVLRKVQKESQLYLEQSRLDLMTGLFNKTYFEQTVGNILQKKASLDTKTFAFAVIDLDHFKQINDNFGHIEGDNALLAIAEFMKNAFHHSAIVGRIGGDEFGVFWHSPESSEKVYEQILNMQASFINHCNYSKDLHCAASISIGVIFSKDRTLSYKEAFQMADHELYKAKAIGPGTISFEREPK